MSAFVVSKEHIDLLVDVALHGPQEARGRMGGWTFRWFDVPNRLLRQEAKKAWQEGGIDCYHVYFNAHRKHATVENADEIGQMLVDANVRSVLHRYPDCMDGGSLPGPLDAYWERAYRHTSHSYRLTAAETLAAIDTYEYQACEHDEWPDSEAELLIRSLGESVWRHVHGYDDAPGDWDAAELAKRGSR